MAKPKITPFQDYEQATNRNGYEVDYVRMTSIQLECMNELSANAFRLYIMMKSYAKGEVRFNFPYRIHKNLFSKQTFTTVRQELIDKGYIEPFASHKSTRTENVYKFSSKWRTRNKDNIKVIIERNKEREKQRKANKDLE